MPIQPARIHSLSTLGEAFRDEGFPELPSCIRTGKAILKTATVSGNARSGNGIGTIATSSRKQGGNPVDWSSKMGSKVRKTALAAVQ